MAKNKASGQAKPAKGKGQNQSKGDDGKAEKEDGTKGQKWEAGVELEVRHILCEKYSKKEEALTRVRAGESFDIVARALSEHKQGDGGSLGWVGEKGCFKIADVAWALEVSSVTDPKIGEKKTDQGYHIIMVEGRRRVKTKK